jgi:hypothetical protein
MPIVLEFELTKNYPLVEMPKFRIICHWLSLKNASFFIYVTRQHETKSSYIYSNSWRKSWPDWTSCGQRIKTTASSSYG